MSRSFDSASEQLPLAVDIAELFPRQGQWEVADYLSLTDQTRHLVELVDGVVEVLPMPTESHQLIVQFLFLQFHRYWADRPRGTVVFAPIRVKTIDERFREPDLALLVDRSDPRRGDRFWSGADLVVEVVSDDPKSRTRDLETKRQEYAKAGIGEYWIVDPTEKAVWVLQLEEGGFREIGRYRSGELAESPLLPGLQVDVTELFASAEA